VLLALPLSPCRESQNKSRRRHGCVSLRFSNPKTSSFAIDVCGSMWFLAHKSTSGMLYDRFRDPLVASLRVYINLCRCYFLTLSLLLFQKIPKSSREHEMAVLSKRNCSAPDGRVLLCSARNTCGLLVWYLWYACVLGTVELVWLSGRVCVCVNKSHNLALLKLYPSSSFLKMRKSPQLLGLTLCCSKRPHSRLMAGFCSALSYTLLDFFVSMHRYSVFWRLSSKNQRRA
jgi:hypothetical protein